MSSFFERHKQKSIWALFLVFISRGRFVGPLLLAVLILGLLFVPEDMRHSIPWASRLAARSGLSDANRAGNLANLFRSGGSEGKSWGLWSGRGIEASYEQKKSSLDMVKPINPKDEMRAASQVNNARTISGIVNPEDAGKMAQGVPLKVEELLSGLVKNANAEAIPGSSGVGPGAALNHGSAVSPEDELIPNGMRGFGSPAVSGGTSTSGSAGRRGKLSAFAWNRANFSINGWAGPSIKGSASPTYKLAETNAYSCLARASGPPQDKTCVSGNYCLSGSCPGEYASYIGGSPFDGMQSGGLGILALDTDPVALTPNAQVAINNGYGTAAQEQNCSSQIASANQRMTAQLTDAFNACCKNVQLLLNACKSRCPWWRFWGCSNNCKNKANNLRNGNAKMCADQYVSSYNGNVKSEDAQCPGKQIPLLQSVSATQWAQCNGGIPYN